MDDVQFVEENLTTKRPFEQNQPEKKGGITNLFIRLGLAKDERQAKYVMYALVIICMILIVYINISTFAPDLLQFGQKKTTTNPSSNTPRQIPQDLNNQ